MYDWKVNTWENPSHFVPGNNSKNWDTHFMINKSDSMFVTMSGCSTFTTTELPSKSLPLHVVNDCLLSIPCALERSLQMPKVRYRVPQTCLKLKWHQTQFWLTILSIWTNGKGSDLLEKWRTKLGVGRICKVKQTNRENYKSGRVDAHCPNFIQHPPR